ncbi:F-box/LRR-repeat protein 14 [Cyphomyrmex costatus]|uniref:F-box/LRR-repeat protein 14 n=1 Tax=Cyphomyrmex costatus TaxID=456900 RepID=A0A151IHE7_9HYME|nr:F-box/LRR-repeat protein 14 [Cyphomyrmex costatus]
MNLFCAGYDSLLRTFQYLKVQELLRAARVCKMWRDLAAHPSLWKTVRMKNSQVTDWDGLADTLQRRGTQHLDLRKMLIACEYPVSVVEEVIKTCSQLEVFSAMSIKCESLTLESIGNLRRCQELRLKAISGMSLQQDLTPLQDLKHLTQLSLTSVKELGKKKIDVIQSLTNLETLELGECSDFPDKFGTIVLINLNKLERLRLEKGQGSCCTFDILEGVSKLQNLNQMELVNFDVKNGFDKCLANCKNIKRLLIILTYISQSATSNNMVLGGVTELSDNLTHFIWGVTLELLRITELFTDQCNLMNKQITGDSIPVLKPVPCLRLISDVEDKNKNQKEADDKQQPHQTGLQVDILPLPQLQKLLLTALPKTRVKILKIPFHATWRQSISDTTTQ